MLERYKVLCESPTTDKMLTAALSAMGYDAADPILRSWHPIWDTDNGKLKSVVFVAMNTKGPQSCMEVERLIDIQKLP